MPTNKPLMAVTVLQPWAWAIIHGRKRVENRTWPTYRRGPLVIHAGLSKRLMTFDRFPDHTKVPRDDMVYKAALGVVDMIECVTFKNPPPETLTPEVVAALQSSYAEGPYCWILGNIRAFPEPIPMAGSMSMWEVPENHASWIRDFMVQAAPTFTLLQGEPSTTYKPGDPRPTGYVAVQEWARVQDQAGLDLKKRRCRHCHEFRYPQEIAEDSDCPRRPICHKCDAARVRG